MSIADDTLIVGEGASLEEAFINHDQRLIAMFERCRQQTLVLNADKMILRRTDRPFVGHLLTSKGLKTQPAKAAAIDRCSYGLV